MIRLCPVFRHCIFFSLTLADKLRQQDGTGCQTATLKNFCLKLIPVMFEMLSMWTVVFTSTQ